MYCYCLNCTAIYADCECRRWHKNIYIKFLSSHLIFICFLRFSALLPFDSPSEFDALMKEFIAYQLLEDKAISEKVWCEAALTEKVESAVVHHCSDVIWNYLLKVHGPDEALCFKRLSKIAKLILILPHSHAEEEWVFSMIRKNRTAFRASLDPKGTLSSVIAIKLAHFEPVSDSPPKAVLKQAKSATWQYNNEHWRK